MAYSTVPSASDKDYVFDLYTTLLIQHRQDIFALDMAITQDNMNSKDKSCTCLYIATIY